MSRQTFFRHGVSGTQTIEPEHFPGPGRRLDGGVEVSENESRNSGELRMLCKAKREKEKEN